MRSNFSFLGDLVKNGIERIGLKGAVHERQAAVIWKDIVGEKTAAVTSIDQVRDGIVYVTCRDSMWAQQLHFLRPLIIEKLNERLGEGVIREVRLSGRGFSPKAKREEQAGSSKKKIEGRLIDEKDIDEIEKAAGVIKDEELARRVIKGLKASRELRKRHE